MKSSFRDPESYLFLHNLWTALIKANDFKIIGFFINIL